MSLLLRHLPSLGFKEYNGQFYLPVSQSVKSWLFSWPTNHEVQDKATRCPWQAGRYPGALRSLRHVHILLLLCFSPLYMSEISSSEQRHVSCAVVKEEVPYHELSSQLSEHVLVGAEACGSQAKVQFKAGAPQMGSSFLCDSSAISLRGGADPSPALVLNWAI